MQEKSLIKQNILQFIEYKGIKKYKFYQETGITRGVLDQNNGMSEENTSRFLAYFTEVDANWLLTGKGSMLKESSSSQPQENDNNEIISLLKDKIALLESNNQLQQDKIACRT